MAQVQLDGTGNEPDMNRVAKLNQMFSDVYNFIGGALSPAVKTATAVAGAATLNTRSGTITSESLTTAAGASYTLTLTDSAILATDIVMATASLGTSTTGTPQVVNTTVTAGQVVIVVKNIHATAAFNGTIKIGFVDYQV